MYFYYRYIFSWLETRTDIIEKNILNVLFYKYYPKLLVHCNDFYRYISVPEIALIQMSCCILESLLETSQECSQHENISKPSGGINSLELHLELIFVYATMWGFGSVLSRDHTIDWCREFHKWWISEFKDVKLPKQESIFDYYLDIKEQKFIRWSELIERKNQKLNLSISARDLFVSTPETEKISYFLKMLIERGFQCMLVGGSGCGKSAILREIFRSFEHEHGVSGKCINIVQTIYLNYYTTSEILQKQLEEQLEKKSGKNYAPIGSSKQLIYFINDFNMPKVDLYGTVQCHTIMRQFMDYKQW